MKARTDIEITHSLDPCELSKLDKKINQEDDIIQFMSSPAYAIISNVIQLLNDSVKSKPRSCERTVRPIINDILDAFKAVHQILDEVEPLNQPMRFGNRAFRTFLTRVYDNRATILAKVTDHPEAHEYFVQSFGSWTRIDYGTGHEFNFLAFIASLAVLNLITPEDGPAIVFDVFWAYWSLHVDIQKKYNQEPAGSHGAWGLDDYVFLPFLFGSAQLIDHPEVNPANVIDPLIAKAHKDEYAYCRWIDFIHTVKKGNFAEHSRMLNSLRKVPHFQKLNGGMIKMYHGEVMDRFLVVQHFRFGTLLKWED
ncbi:phosphotyrosyl phosphatase activator [Tritrichomonas foetus]|uniref:Serine/threonine-protein phosphatase 2A activator n=1 Tax=Tritrichomonas foetus TaxID=1144522 RepID=A0A1J4KS97_9EUKA|nr:phosphotyrosyl phosphatase activator [Tritrichomonas foetus]|eukprot:OHT12692.1 phosphotyrosyl phosphatase activator [Tritrichomonas foetus]